MSKAKKFIDKFIINNRGLLFAIIIILIILLGAKLFQNFEGWSFFDSLYYLIITITTIGYGDFTPTNNFTKILTMIYGFMGVPIFIGATSLFFKSIIKKNINKHIYQIKKELEETEAILTEQKEQMQKDHKKLSQTSKKIDKTEKEIEKNISNEEKLKRQIDKLKKEQKKENKGFFKKLFKKK